MSRLAQVTAAVPRHHPRGEPHLGHVTGLRIKTGVKSGPVETGPAHMVRWTRLVQMRCKTVAGLRGNLPRAPGPQETRISPWDRTHASSAQFGAREQRSTGRRSAGLQKVLSGLDSTPAGRALAGKDSVTGKQRWQDDRVPSDELEVEWEGEGGQEYAPHEDDDADDDWDDETFAKQAPKQRKSVVSGLTELDLNRWRLKPVEEKYRIQVERNVSEERKAELGVDFWSAWTSPGPCAYQWEWRADEQIFITRGTLRVTPFGCEDSAVFQAGDLVRFPKWMLAELEIGGNYEQRYRFRAYGDDN